MTKQNKNNVGELFGITTEKIKAMVDVDSILGTPIKIENVTIIPVSKVTYGFGTGGSDFATKNKNDLFGGGGGAGITIAPVAFIVISDGDVRIKPISTGDDPLERAITLIPDAIDKLVDLVGKLKSKKKSNEENEDEASADEE